GLGHGCAEPVFGDDHISHHIALGVEDSKVWGVHPATSITQGRGLFGDLKAQVFPAAKPGCQHRTTAHRPNPFVLSALTARQYRLSTPLEADRFAEGATGGPL